MDHIPVANITLSPYTCPMKDLYPISRQPSGSEKKNNQKHMSGKLVQIMGHICKNKCIFLMYNKINVMIFKECTTQATDSLMMFTV